MAIVLYDLCGADGRRFSPHCWRTRMALAHKGLETDSRPTRFSEIAGIADRQRKVLPTIQDGDTVVEDSWRIAEYLEETYPERPSLFGGATGKALAGFVQNWVGLELQVRLVRMILADIHAILDPADQAYFRESREKRFGKRLEAVQAERDEVWPAWQAALKPLQLSLRNRPFVSGDSPAYADYLVFGAVQWARCCSEARILPEDMPELGEWFGRMLDLYDGLGRRETACW